MQRIVDNRVLLLGIDQHCRDAMKLFEAKVLLECAAAVATRLAVSDEDVPLEGYYADPSIPELARYFRLMRALQKVPEKDASAVGDSPELKRILKVISSGMYGRPVYDSGGGRMMLPTGRDAFSDALRNLDPTQWGIGTLTREARQAAIHNDDISLVGLAARAADAVALAALRESVVLYAEKVLLISDDGPSSDEYVWRVEPEIERCANRFIENFDRVVASANSTFPASVWMSGPFEPRAVTPIPRADPQNAAHFYGCYEENDIMGRCVHVGTRLDTGAHYHWAVRGSVSEEGTGEVGVHDFWSNELWTTSRYHGANKQPEWDSMRSVIERQQWRATWARPLNR